MRGGQRLLLLLLLPGLAGAPHPASAAGDLAEVEGCVEANLPRSSVQTIRMRTRDRVDAVNELEATIQWARDEEDRSRALIRFQSPPDMRGSAVLVLEREDTNDMFMYLPELRRVRRITGRMVSGSMFGTDFSYEEFERLVSASEDAEGTRLEDGEVEGRPVWVVRYESRDGDGRYAYVLSHVDQATCVPLRVGFYESDSGPTKLMETRAEDVKKVGGSWVPHRVLMKDLEDKTETELVVEKVEVDVELADRVFSTRQLARGN